MRVIILGIISGLHRNEVIKTNFAGIILYKQCDFAGNVVFAMIP